MAAGEAGGEVSVPAGRALSVGDSGVPPPGVGIHDGLGPRPPGTPDWPRPLVGPRPAGSPRWFPERARRAPEAGEEAGAPAGSGGETGKALEGCPDIGALPGRGACGFRMGVVVAGRGGGGR